MIKDIKELNFPKYATLSQATVTLQDMAEKTITAQVKIDGQIAPNFSEDWAVEFRGEKYIMPLRLPQGTKENASLNSTFDLTFQHWAVYQLKRWYFFTVQPVEAGTVIPDQYKASVILNLKDLCTLIGQVLQYHYGETITIVLNPDWEYTQEGVRVDISHTYIWDVLIKLYDLYAVRWQIEPRDDNDNTTIGGERYIIKVGYPTSEMSHIFRHGFVGGLLKVERQVQDENIRNMLIGRGGETNLPRYYFKLIPDGEKDMYHQDPDWVKELADIWFDRLRGATFRSYIQGWKAAHIADYPDYIPVAEAEAYAPWAFHKGFTDSKFAPVEYVADEIVVVPSEGDRYIELSPDYVPAIKGASSIDRYGPLFGGVDDNDDIYPSIQGTGMDIAVDVEQISSDNENDSVPLDVTITTLSGVSAEATLGPHARATVTTRRIPFSVPAGKTANLILSMRILGDGSKAEIEHDSSLINVYDVKGNRRSASGIPAGSYSYELVMSLHNITDQTVMTRAGADKVRLQDATLADFKGGTFDIWVKDIWNSSRLPDESDEAFAERVWKPVLGDRQGNTAKVMFTSGELAISEDYEFTIINFPVYDVSKEFQEKDDKGNVSATHTSMWRITLAKSDAELESTGLYVPSARRQGKPGDRFVFIGTEMTHDYTLWAEIALDDSKKDILNDKKDIKPTWTVTPDRVRLSGGGVPDALINQIKVGSSLRLYDRQLIPGSAQELLYIQSVTLTYREPSDTDAALNPDVEIVLSDKYETAANPISLLQGEVSAIQKQLGSVSNISQIVSKIGDKKYLRKDAADRTPFGLSVGGTLTVGNYSSDSTGVILTPTGEAELLSVLVRSLLSSPRFADGLAGEGWRIWLEDGLSHLTIDKLTVRQIMTVFELLIEKVRSVGGQICVSAANGKIKDVGDADSDGFIPISFEQENSFQEGDLMRCQTFSGGSLKHYWVEVASATAESVKVHSSQFIGQSQPSPGDECVLMGNTVNALRSSLILISATEDGQPRIDVLDGVHDTNFTGCLRTRLGSLDGITDSRFPADNQPHGNGLYSDNAYLRGTFLLVTGEDIKTKFEVTEGKITSAVDGLRSDVDLPGNFISNPMFASGMDGWEEYDPTGSVSPLADAPEAAASIDTDSGGMEQLNTIHVRRDSTGRPVLFIKNKCVMQQRTSMRGEPDNYPVNSEGLNEPATVFLSFLCRSSTGGRLSMWIQSSTRPGFVERYTPLSSEVQIVASESYQLISCSGLWNGTGALIIEMEGEAEIYMVTLSQDKTATLAYTYRTLFKQSDKLITLAAENFDADGKVLSGSYIEQSASQIALSVMDENLRPTGIDISNGEIVLISDKVRFTDSDGHNQAFIHNGKINAQAIDADTLTASRLEMYMRNADGTRPSNPSVLITPEAKGMQVLSDSSGLICQEFSGAEYRSGISDFFGTDAGASFSMIQSGGEVGFRPSSTPAAGDSEIVELDASQPVRLSAPASIVVTSGQLSASAEALSGTVPADDPSVLVPTIYSSASASVSLILRVYEDAACTVPAEEWVVASVAASSAARRDSSPIENDTAGQKEYTYTAVPDLKVADCTSKSVRTRSGGYAKLILSYRCAASRVGCRAVASWGYRVPSSGALTAEYKTDLYVSRFFANGFCLGSRIDDYILAYHSSDGMCFEHRTGSGSGLRITPSEGVQSLVYGSVSQSMWAPAPRFLCRMGFTFRKSVSSYYGKGIFSFDGSYPTAIRNSAGSLRIRFPSSWASLLGDAFTQDRLQIHVEGRNGSSVYGAVTYVSTTDADVLLMSASGAASDAAFLISIELV